MYFNKNTLIENTTKNDFININNMSEIVDWGKSNNLSLIQKAIAFVEKGLNLYKEDKSKKSNSFIEDCGHALCNAISENENLDDETLEYIFNKFCVGEYSNLNIRSNDIVSKIAKNSSTSQKLKEKLLKEHNKFEDDEYIISCLASNKNNTSKFLLDIYKNHQGQFIEFRSGMGCSWLNENIAKNINTPESIKISMIKELPSIIENKSKEFNNMSSHPSHFNNIYKAIAENPNTTENVFEKLFDEKDRFNQKMDYTYYVAKNTKSANLLDKIVRDNNNYNKIYQALFNNKNLNSNTIDYIIKSKDISIDEKKRLVFNPSVLNSSQLSALVKNLGNYNINNVNEILNYSICNKEVCNSLLQNYSASFKPNVEAIKLVTEKLEHIEREELFAEPSNADRAEAIKELNKPKSLDYN